MSNKTETIIAITVLTIYLVSAVLFCNGQYVYNILKANL